VRPSAGLRHRQAETLLPSPTLNFTTFGDHRQPRSGERLTRRA
jgi:hypothetical protein